MTVLISIATEEDSGTWAEALMHSPWLNVSDYHDLPGAGFSYFPAPETPAAELEAVAGVVFGRDGDSRHERGVNS